MNLFRRKNHSGEEAPHFCELFLLPRCQSGLGGLACDPAYSHLSRHCSCSFGCCPSLTHHTGPNDVLLIQGEVESLSLFGPKETDIAGNSCRICLCQPEPRELCVLLAVECRYLRPPVQTRLPDPESHTKDQRAWTLGCCYKMREYLINAQDLKKKNDNLMVVTYCNKQERPSMNYISGLSLEQCNFRKIPPGSNTSF